MQAREAERLNREWKLKHKNEICNHPNVEKEYDLGASTGDYVCIICGEAGSGRDWPERERIKRENKQK